MSSLTAQPFDLAALSLDFPKKGDIVAGKYQVEEVLGTGGMGVVVAARHVALRQRVAIKFLLPCAFGLPGAPARFLREARASVAIRSEHVARVLDVGELPTGSPYMVMEHLSGKDLSEVLEERGVLPVMEAVDDVLQACEAIAVAHALGIVHRDLKPGNLFLTTRPDGSSLVKVLDFGLSKMREEQGACVSSLTATSIVVGSPYYMSPEQVRSLKYVDERTDIWALGVILYELLTGRRPFDGATLPAVCAAVVADTPRAMRTIRREVPEELDTLVRGCLEKDPARRFQSVSDLARGLFAFAHRGSTLSVPEEALDVVFITDPPPPPGAPKKPPAKPPPLPPRALAASSAVWPSAAMSAPVVPHEMNAWGRTLPLQPGRPALVFGLTTGLLALIVVVFLWRGSLPEEPSSAAPGPSMAEIARAAPAALTMSSAAPPSSQAPPKASAPPPTASAPPPKASAKPAAGKNASTRSSKKSSQPAATSYTPSEL